MKAHEALEAAAALVGGDRARTHGDKIATHANIARMWNAYLDCRPVDRGHAVTSKDVAVMMCLLKIARSSLGSHNSDDYVDMAGYAGIAGEIAALEVAE